LWAKPRCRCPSRCPALPIGRAWQPWSWCFRVTEIDGVETGEISYYLSSLPPKVKALATAIRQHWSIESQLHWVLDVTFTEDASRIRQRHAPQTSAMLRRLAVSILSSDTSLKIVSEANATEPDSRTDALERILLSFVEN